MAPMEEPVEEPVEEATQQPTEVPANETITIDVRPRETRTSLRKHKVPQLRNLCKKHGLEMVGTKDVLIHRLLQADLPA